MKNRVLKQELVEWKKLKWLQGELKKISPIQMRKLKHSLKDSQFVQPLNVWQTKKGLYILGLETVNRM